jgi:hypothetical protein
VKKESGTENLPIYYDKDPVSGVVKVTVNSGKKVEHNGINIQLIGQIGS